MTHILHTAPDSKVHGANMGPIWGRQVPDGPHAGPMNFAIWGALKIMSAQTHGSYYDLSGMCHR